MTITSNATPGIEIDTAAKESRLTASTLGSQTAAAPNEVIVPDALSANNEGDLEISPVYPGRMFCLRPWEMKLVTAVLASGGTSYTAADVLTLTGGVAGPGGAPQITVDTVDGGGTITSFSITREASYELRTDNQTSSPSPPISATLSLTGGTGSGATLNCETSVFAPHFELRFITADASLTLTVHEDWIVPPVSGDNWAISYILEDVATKTGCTLRAQSGVFEFTRILHVGSVTPGSDRGFFSLNGGKAMELDNTGNTMRVRTGGCMTCGYRQAGASVDGGYITTSHTSATVFTLHWGFLTYIYDIQIRSPQTDLDIVVSTAGITDGDEIRCSELENTWQDFKVFDNTRFDGTWQKVRNAVIQGQTSLISGFFWTLYDADNNTWADLNGAIMVDCVDGLRVFNVVADLPLEGARNVQWVNSTLATIGNGAQTYNVVNPIWTPDLSDGTSPGSSLFDFAHATLGAVNEFMSLVIRGVDSAGDDITGVRGYVYEGANADELPGDNTNDSLTAPVDDTRFNDEYEGSVRYVTDVLNNVYTPLSGAVVQEVRGFFAWRGYNYGTLPQTVPFDVALSGGLDVQAAFIADVAITEPVQATALTNPTTNPTVTKHGPGETDTRPMKALKYDAGVGSVPTIGETMTQGSATGVVAAYEGTGVEGVMLLDTWNGTEFTEDSNITGGTSTFDATTNLAGGSGFYEEYTWEVNAQSEAMTVVYDYLAARMAEDPVTAAFKPVIVWGGNEPDASQLLFLGTTGYFTPRAVRQQTGRVLDSATRDFSDDFNRADEDLSASANWDDVDNAANHLRVLTNEVGEHNTASTTNVGAVATSAHTYDDDQYAEMTISTLPTSGAFLGVAVRIDSTLEQCYAGGVLEGTPDVWEIAKVDFSTGAGVFTVLATGSSTPTAADIIRLVAIDSTIILFVNGLEECRYTDVTTLDQTALASGQAGIVAEGDAAPAGRGDDFGSGDFLPAVAHGEGVWVHSRGTGTMAFQTSDSGTTFTPEVTVTLQVTVLDADGNPVEGVKVRIVASPDSPGKTPISQGLTNASGVYADATYSYSGDVGVDIKARLKGFKFFRTTGTITSTGLSAGVRFDFNPIVDLP